MRSRGEQLEEERKRLAALWAEVTEEQRLMEKEREENNRLREEVGAQQRRRSREKKNKKRVSFTLPQESDSDSDW